MTAPTVMMQPHAADQAKMHEMMLDPKMKEMMHMDMMGLQMMKDGMMGKHSQEHSENYAQ